jgi:hypothetical protein
MLPNDSQLRLSEAHTTMALRHHESAQERLALEARSAAAGDPASHPSSRETAMNTLIRPATILLTVVIAISALFAAIAPPAPATAGRQMLATSPRMVGVESTTDLDQLLASSRRVL